MRVKAAPLLFRLFNLLVLGLCLLTLARPGIAANDISPIPVSDSGQEAWLVTFGPGEIYWERFGHNAIWLREPAIGLDHTFNFGFFDFEQEDFFLRFLRGRMLYFSVAQSVEREFSFYRQTNRDIRIQKIALTDTQYEALRDFLVKEIRPENRDYRYDYYLSNCSTRVRDALDMALDGRLSASTAHQPSVMNFREQTRRLTQSQFWYYLGLELALGSPVDRPVSRWDEMFIPMVLADELAILQDAAGEPVTSVDTMLFSSSQQPPPDTPGSIWYRYLLLGLLVTAVAWVSGRWMPPVWIHGLCGAWVLIGFTNGLILAGLWFFTDHEVAKMNANLLLFNPLVIVALVPSLHRLAALTYAVGVGLAALLLLPGVQYNLDVLALVGPVNLAAAVFLFRRKLSLK